MYAIGHIALGYIVGKMLSKMTGRPINLIFVMALSLLPDIDFFLPGIHHRSITHSIILGFVIFIPFLIYDFKKFIPYLGVLLSHSIIGDFYTGRVLLLWPLSNQFFIYSNAVLVKSLEEAYLEVILFGVFSTILIITKDYDQFFVSGWENLLLFVPFGAILASILLINYSNNDQKLLITPHLLLLGAIVISFINTALHSINRLFDIGI